MLSLRRSEHVNIQKLESVEPVPFENLPEDLKLRIACKIIFLNKNFLSVSKSWQKSWQEIFKGIIHHTLPMYKREEIIHHLSHLILSDRQNAKKLEHFINLYQNEKKLTSNSTVKFIYNWLGHKPLASSEMNLEEDDFPEELTNRLLTIQALALKDVELMKDFESSADVKFDSAEFLLSLLKDGEIENAFAYAARLDQNEKKSENSLVVQKFILNKDNGLGLDFDQAFKLTETLNTNESKIPALTAFFILGCQDLVINEKADMGEMTILNNHSFIRFLKNNPIENLPKEAVYPLIPKIYSLLKQQHDSFETSDIADELIETLFEVIPTTFDFFDEMKRGLEGCSTTLIDFYQEPIYEDGIVPFSERIMKKRQANEFIIEINLIPHPGLKKQIYENIMDGFYSDNPDMCQWIGIIERIENKTKQSNRAIEELINQCLNEGLNKFKTTFNQPKNIARLIDLLARHPDWFTSIAPEETNNGIELEYNKSELSEDLDFLEESPNSIDHFPSSKSIYLVIANLLIENNQKELLSIVFDNIKNPILKNELEDELKR